MQLRLRLLNARLDWCHRLRALSRTREEKEGWLAEEEGLRDAFRGRDRSDLIRVCFPAHVERYRLGFDDGLRTRDLRITATMANFQGMCR